MVVKLFLKWNRVKAIPLFIVSCFIVTPFLLILGSFAKIFGRICSACFFTACLMSLKLKYKNYTYNFKK